MIKYVKLDADGRIVSVSSCPYELPEDYAKERGLFPLQDSGTIASPLFRLYDHATQTAGELKAVAPSAT